MHWIWKSLRFDTHNLQTREGHDLRIIQPGTPNSSDGPDFKAARLYLDDLYWYGDIEIHVDEQDWYHHQHHKDAKYNGVILHVVINENAAQRVFRKDKTRPPTLVLKPYLEKNLHHFVRKYFRSKGDNNIPCSHHPNGMLRDDIFFEQLRYAHQEYFYQKIYDQYRFWDAQLPWQLAWKKMLAISLFDGLGISHNRESMVRLAWHLYNLNLHQKPVAELTRLALKLAGLNNSRTLSSNNRHVLNFNWNFKGVRPNNHPEKRITQAVYLLKRIQHTSMNVILKQHPWQLWDQWVQKDTLELTGLGSQRSNILYSISLIPSLKIAADQTDNRIRGSRLKQVWNRIRVAIPKKYSKCLDNTQINKDIYTRCLGTVYQLRHYCFKFRCRDCMVFKRAFFS